MNEGLLFQGTFGTDPAHTEDHPPVILNGLLPDDHEGVDAGTLLVVSSGGTFHPYDGTGDIAGVCNWPVPKGKADMSYLAHGTAKASRLKLANGSAFTNYAALKAIGIFAV